MKVVLPSARIHSIHKGNLFASSSNKVLVSRDWGGHWEVCFELPISLQERLKSISELAARFFRSGIYHVADTGDHIVVFGYGSIWRYDKNERNVERISRLVGSRPLFLCQTDAELYYGAYSSNPERHPVSLFRGTVGGKDWGEAFQFTGVRHIHGVFNDEHSGSLWVTTGDEDSESCIFRTDKSFSSIEKVLGGSQQTRAVQLVFDSEYVYFGTDTAREENHIYRMRRSGAGLERLQKVGGSVMWGCRAGGRVFFSTAVEPGSVNLQSSAELWASDHAGINWKKICGFKKDIWHKRLFQYGQIFMPSGDSSPGAVFFSPFAAGCGMNVYKMDSGDV